ncbi:MAG: hypothetical protein ABI634_04585 [Acidobacteriota bacterium]
MPPRQVWLFQLGCWVAFATAIAHLVEHISGLNALAPETVANINTLRATYVILIPGLHQPTFLGVLNGFSLSLSLLVATMGAVGLVVLKYGEDQPLLLRGVARALAIGTGMLLALSIEGFFSLQTFFMATMALCFALSAVSQEA